MSDSFEQPRDDKVIRFTSADLESTHVDDMLQRQSNLKGESGGDRGKKAWYYRNWFLFMVVGGLCALGAWAWLEPYFDDTFYIQGAVTQLDLSEEMPQVFTEGNMNYEIPEVGQGRLNIRENRVWLMEGTREMLPDGSTEDLNFSKLREGQEIGVYVHTFEMNLDEQGFATHVVLEPPEPTAKSQLDIGHLRNRSTAGGILLFPLVAGLIGLGIGMVDGIVCRLPRRAFLGGLLGLLVGFVGGFLSGILAGLIYTPLSNLAMGEMDDSGGVTTFGFILQMIGRTIAWAIAGMAMGLGQGIALRSSRLLVYGFLGGLIGGLLGGLLFDPIDILLLGMDKPSAHWSRMIGITVIGLTVGAMIGIVELLARDAWLRMQQGPLAGKEFLLFKDTMRLGSSPRSEIYLFNDDKVSEHHATLRMVGDDAEIENHDNTNPVLLNSRPIRTSRLRSGDKISIGSTIFVYEKRK